MFVCFFKGAVPLRNMHTHKETDGLPKEKSLDILLWVVMLRDKQHITFNCGTYCNFTANLLPLKMPVALPEIYLS